MKTFRHSRYITPLMSFIISLILCGTLFNTPAYAESSLFRLEYVKQAWSNYGEFYEREMGKPYETWYFLDNSHIYVSNGKRYTYTSYLSGNQTVVKLDQSSSYDDDRIYIGQTSASADNYSSSTYGGASYYFNVQRNQTAFTSSVTYDGQKGSKMFFHCSAQGGAGEYKYKYHLYDSDGNLLLTGNPTEDNFSIWSARDEEEFELFLTATDANNDVSEYSRVKFSFTGDPNYMIIDGNIARYKGTETELVIPETILGETVTGINADVFSGKGITELTLPDTITSLDSDAFKNCSANIHCNVDTATARAVSGIGRNFYALDDNKFAVRYIADDDLRLLNYSGTETDVVMPDYVNSIASSVFKNSALTGISFSRNLRTINSEAFYNCDGLSELVFPDSVTAINQIAFYDCDGLTSVTLGAGVKTIGESAFRSCDKLVSFEMNNGLETIGSYVFDGDPIEELLFPDSVTSLDPTAIYGYKYTNNGSTVTNNSILKASLKKVRWPAGVKTVPADQFNNFTALEEIEISEGVTAIGTYTFNNCSALTSLILPESLKTIGTYAFYNCDGLTELVFPNSVTAINQIAFYDCDGLTSVTLGAGVKTIGESAFRSCDKLVSFEMNNGLETIGSYVFDGDPIEELLFPDSVTSLDPTAIYGYKYTNNGSTVTNNSILKASLKKVRWPAGVGTVPDSQFRYFTALEEIELSEELVNISGYAFQGCSSLADVYYNGLQQEWDQISVGSNNDSIMNARLHCLEPDFILPSFLTEIESEAFAGGAFTCVVVPETVTSVGSRAFADCPNLKLIYFVNGNANVAEDFIANANFSVRIKAPAESIVANNLAEYYSYLTYCDPKPEPSD